MGFGHSAASRGCGFQRLAVPLGPGAVEMGHVLSPELLHGGAVVLAGLCLSGSLEN